MRRRTLIVGGMSLAIFLGVMNAQNITATIVGTVRDSSGAAVAGAQVTAVQDATRFTRSTTTDEIGNYVLPLLPAGDYRVHVEARGFKKAERTGVTLKLEDRLRVDFALELGAVTETIEIREALPVVQTESAERGTVIENAQIIELPLNGRNFTTLMRLTPGAGDYRGAATASVAPDDSRPRVSFGGVSSIYNRFLLDGASNMDFHDAQTIINPSVDAMQEFNIKGNHYNAEFGGGGGIVNATIKSGTNQFHGVAFEFLRNDKLDARPFFSPSRNPFRYNQFGGVFSGPVKLPKLYDGRNRTFFLVNYEGRRIRTPSDRFLRVPTVAERGGDFSGKSPIYDPFNVSANNQRTPFPGNVIPRARWSPYADKLLRYYPEPNIPLNPRNQNYFAPARNETDDNQHTVRVDERLSDRFNLFGRYSQSQWDILTGENFPYSGGNFRQVRGKQLALGLTAVLSSRFINEFRFAFGDYAYYPELAPRRDRNYDKELGFAYADRLEPLDFAFPRIQPQTYAGLGNSDSRVRRNFGPNTLYAVNDTLTRVHGRHTMKAGFVLERFLAESGPNVFNRTFTFNNQYTALVAAGRFTGGDQLADMLLGFPFEVTYMPVLPGIGRLPNLVKAYSLAGFVQDDFKVNSRLTLSYGLRYELNLPPLEVNDRTLVGAIDSNGRINYPKTLKIDDSLLTPQFTQPTTVAPQVIQPGRYFSRIDRRRLWYTDANNFQPRLGLAIRPFGEKTAVRLSYGLFNGRHTGKLGFTGGLGAPFAIQQIDRQDQTGPPGPLRLGELPAANFTPAGIFQYNVIPLDTPDPLIQSWTASVQRELPGKILLEASYLGNRVDHVQVTHIFNTRLVPGAETGVGCPAPCPVARPFPRPYPWFGEERTRGGFSWSNFHSGTLKLERRFSAGLGFLATYMWSKGMDGGGQAVGDDQSGAPWWPDNRFNLRAEKAVSLLVPRQRFVASWIYDLPFGRSRSWLASSAKPVNFLVSGWQITGIWTIQTGFGVSVTTNGDITGTGLSSSRANRLANGNLPPEQRTLDRWFDTSAFVTQPLNTFGNSARRIIEGPGLFMVDLGVFRQFRISENHRLQFRAEFFNTPNHPNFGLPTAVINDPNYGKITSTSTAPRNIQLALKYLF